MVSPGGLTASRSSAFRRARSWRSMASRADVMARHWRFLASCPAAMFRGYVRGVEEFAKCAQPRRDKSPDRACSAGTDRRRRSCPTAARAIWTWIRGARHVRSTRGRSCSRASTDRARRRHPAVCQSLVSCGSQRRCRKNRGPLMGLNVGEIFTERGLMLATTKRAKLEARQLRDGSAFFTAMEYSHKIAPKSFAIKSGRYARAPKGYRAAAARKPLGGAPRTGGIVSHYKILPAPFFDAVKAELFDLICTNSKKYEALRKRLKMAANASQTLLVSTLPPISAITSIKAQGRERGRYRKW